MRLVLCFFIAFIASCASGKRTAQNPAPQVERGLYIDCYITNEGTDIQEQICRIAAKDINSMKLETKKEADRASYFLLNKIAEALDKRTSYMYEVRDALNRDRFYSQCIHNLTGNKSAWNVTCLNVFSGVCEHLYNEPCITNENLEEAIHFGAK